MSDALVPLGVITRPHGVRGEVRAHLFNQESDFVLGLSSLKLRRGDAVETKKVLKATRAAKYLIIRLKGVADREAAEALRGAEIVVPRDELPDLDEDEFYLGDLVGLVVQQEGQEVGEVVDVLEYPSVVCIRVRAEDGHREVPLVEPWLHDVDLEAGVVHIGPWDDIPVQS